MKALVTGAAGLLGTTLTARLRASGAGISAFDSKTLDITDRKHVLAVIGSAAPDVVWHCAAYTAVDRAESEPDRALLVNGQGTANVADACRAVGATLVYFSTDFVFDGEAQRPYEPNAMPSPTTVYGRSKLEGERAVVASGADHLIVRTSWLFGAGGRHFVQAVTERARAGQDLRVVDDQIGRPTWTGSLARSSIDLLGMGARGVFHVADRGTATWLELARYALSLQGIEADVRGVTTAEWGAPAPRPAYSVLALAPTEALLGYRLPTWRETLRSYLEEGVR